MAVELGWVTTEVGRQPWIVYGVMRVASAVNPEPGVQDELWVVAAVYAALTVVTVVVLRRLVRSVPVPLAPQETDVKEYEVV